MQRRFKPTKSRKGRRHNTKRTCSGKVRYRDRQEADAALKRLNSSGRQKVPSRKYECFGCNGWHLTSRPNRFGNI